MTMANPTAPARPQAIAVVGAASHFAARLLHHLEWAFPNCRLVTFAERPLRWPVEQVTSYRLRRNRVPGTLSISDIPEVLQHRAWDVAAESRRITISDIDDFLQVEAVDSLIHLGSHYDGPDPEQFLIDTRRWTQAARNAGVRQFVYLSDYRVYGVRPGNPIPLTELTATNPLPAHQILRDAEPDIDAPGDLAVALLRTAMTVGPNGCNPAAHEFLQPRLFRDKNRSSLPLQFLHEYDLARALETVVTQQLAGLYNLAGNGSVSLRDVITLGQPRQRRSKRRDKPLAQQPENPNSRRPAGGAAKCPMILSATKFKQAGRFAFRYSSGQAIRAYCHSVLLEPD